MLSVQPYWVREKVCAEAAFDFYVFAIVKLSFMRV